ncbi:hypothetical protein [Streptomyces sp. NPDC055134]
MPHPAPSPTPTPHPRLAWEEERDPTDDFVASHGGHPEHSDPEADAKAVQAIDDAIAAVALRGLSFDAPWYVNEETVLRTALACFDPPPTNLREADRQVQHLAIRFGIVDTGDADEPTATVAVCPTRGRKKHTEPVEPAPRNGTEKTERRLAETSAVLTALHGSLDAAVGQAVRAIVIGRPDWQFGLVRAATDTFLIYVMPTKLFSTVASMLGDAVRNINNEREEREKTVRRDFGVGQGLGGLARQADGSGQ